MTRTRLLVLFDIDGTILSAQRSSKTAVIEALEEVFGTAGPVNDYDYSGKTDPQIVRQLMRGAGFEDGEIDRRMERVLRRYRERLEAIVRPEDIIPKPGIGPLVEALAAEPHVTLALLTGNLEPCARIKLAPLDMNRRFPFGAFGSDDEDRYRLPAVAVERAHVATGHRFEGKRIVIVGDSVHDVRCGQSLGVRAVAVASGKVPYETLAAERPDSLFRNFADTAAALEAIAGS